MPAGPHVATWDGRDSTAARSAPGIYFVRLMTPTRTFQRRIVALR